MKTSEKLMSGAVMMSCSFPEKKNGS